MKKPFSTHLLLSAVRLTFAIASLSFHGLSQGLSEAQVTYQFTEIQPASGFTQSQVTGVNDRNEMSGNSFPPTIDWNGVATKWSGGKPINLRRHERGTYSSATAINSRGIVVGDGDDGNLRPNAVRFGSSRPSILTSGLNNSYAIFITDSGIIFGNSISGFDSPWLPTVWTEEPGRPGRYRMETLPLISDPGDGSADCFVYGANNMGEVVGIASNSVVGQQAVIWNRDSNHTLQILPPAEGFLAGNAFGINDLGVVVGACLNGSMKPVMWLQDGNRTPVILPLFPGEDDGYAVGINNSGQIIGYHGALHKPAVWLNGEIIDLQSCLSDRDKGFELVEVNDINNYGVIVGTGRKNGILRGFMLTPVSRTVGFRP